MAKWMRVSGEAAKRAQESLGGKLTPPDNARVARDKVTNFWNEFVQITDASAEETQSNAGDTHVVLTVEGVIQPTRPTGEPSTAGGRTVRMRTRLNWAAFDHGDPKDGQFKMHNGSVARMMILLREVGLYDEGDIEPEVWAAAFPDEGLSPFVGLTLGAEIKQGPNDKGDVFPEVSRFLPSDALPAATEAGAGMVSV